MKKGAKSELVIFWKFFESQKQTGEAESSEQPTKRRSLLLRYYRVFNVAQTKGLEKQLPPAPEEQPFTPMETAAHHRGDAATPADPARRAERLVSARA